MRFLTLYRPHKPAPPDKQMTAEMAKFGQDMTKAGILLATDGTQPGGIHVRIRLSGGKLTVTDGPFAEAKELVGGYAVLKVDSLEQLAQVSERFLKIAGDGDSEAIEMFDGAPPKMV
jgi:hypothetical protein